MTDEPANVHRACLSLAAVASAAAGLVHAAAAGTHAGDRTLAVLFAVFAVAQVAWPALEAVLGVPRGERLRIVVVARGARHQTHVTFARDAALSWLATCADHASRRRLRPEPIEGVEGFRAG